MPAHREGPLVAVGGGEDKAGGMLVLRHVMEHAPPAPRVVIVPTASRDPLWAAAPHVDAFRRLGAGHVDVLDVRTREQAALDAHVALARGADVLYMTGGDQARLSAVLARTPVLAAMRDARGRGAVVAGTSAGAAAMSATMIADGDATWRVGDVRLAPGLGLLDRAIVDSHFTERGRFARLFEAVATHPRLLGIGLGEDTGIVVRGADAEVIGTGTVVVVDGRELRHAPAADAVPGEPVDAERMIVHALSAGRRFRMGPPESVAMARRGRAKA